MSTAGPTRDAKSDIVTGFKSSDQEAGGSPQSDQKDKPLDYHYLIFVPGGLASPIEGEPKVEGEGGAGELLVEVVKLGGRASSRIIVDLNALTNSCTNFKIALFMF